MSILKSKWFDLFFFKEVKALLLLVAVCLLLSSYWGYLTPQMVLNLSKNYSDKELFYHSILQLFGLFFLVYGNRVIYQLAINQYVKLLMQKVRSNCFEKWILHYDIESKDSTGGRYTQGEVIARIMSDTLAIRELITSGTFAIFINIFFVLSCLISFIQINKFSGLFLSGIVSILTIFLIWMGKYIRVVFYKVRQANGIVSKNVANVVGGLRESYYTNHQNYASKTCSIAFNDFLGKQLKANIWDASYYSVAESFYPLLLALVIFIFPYSHITSAAVIFAIVDLIQRTIEPMKLLASKISNVYRAITGIQRIDEFTSDLMMGLSSPKEKARSPSLPFDSLEVVIDHFSYLRAKRWSEFSLKKISFMAHRGDLIGLVGLSGCGKSTLLNIIAGNIIPLEGRIALKGDRQTLYFPGKGLEDIVTYREQVGLVSQDSHIFSESLLFNITLTSSPSKEFDTFWEWICEKIPYLRHWGIVPRDVISPLALSLGQNQLISAMRACFLRKNMVLFDEVCSGLDSHLEEALRKVILLIQKNSITVIVAHRLETIIQADNILVMEDGYLRAIGKHENLLKSSKIYRQFISELSHEKKGCMTGE